jgi:hypothetical protein
VQPCGQGGADGQNTPPALHRPWLASQPKTGQSSSLWQVQLPSAQSRWQAPGAGVTSSLLPLQAVTAISQYWPTEPTGGQSASAQQLRDEPELPLVPELDWHAQTQAPSSQTRRMSEQMLHSSGSDLWQSESTAQPPVVLPVLAEVPPVADVPEEVPPSPGLMKQPVSAATKTAVKARGGVDMSRFSASGVPRATARSDEPGGWARLRNPGGGTGFPFPTWSSRDRAPDAKKREGARLLAA